MTKEQEDWWREDIQKLAYNPTEKHLSEMKKLLEGKSKKEFTESEVRESHTNLFTLFSLTASMGVKKARETKRAKRIKEWRKEHKEKDKKVLKTIPFDNIKCDKCQSAMTYKWSELWEEGIENPIQKVMFFYKCPNTCMDKMIFEDGTPWISKENNKCAVCGGERKNTITKDATGKSFVIYECVRCKSRQVETVLE